MSLMGHLEKGLKNYIISFVPIPMKTINNISTVVSKSGFVTGVCHRDRDPIESETVLGLQMFEVTFRDIKQ